MSATAVPDVVPSPSPGAVPVLVPAAATPKRGVADRIARKVLFLPEQPRGRAGDVHNIFSSSMVLSGTRCVLAYIVFPLLRPALLAFGPLEAAIGLPIGVLALICDVFAIRRFFRADHAWRWVAAALYFTIMVMVSYLVVRDAVHLS